MGNNRKTQFIPADQIEQLEKRLAEEKEAACYSRRYLKYRIGVDLGRGGIIRSFNQETQQFCIYATEKIFLQSRRGSGKHAFSTVLGKGGYGVVKLVVNIRDANDKKALKILHLQNESDVKCVENEAATLGNLKKGAGQVLFKKREVSKGDALTRKYYILMDYYSGMSLTSLLDRYPRHISGPTERFEMTFKMIAEVKKLHEAGYLHRDLSPNNFLYHRSQALHSLSMHLIDFGFARKISEKDDFKGGTPGYIAPEIAKEGHSIASDIYALGRILQSLFGIMETNGRVPWGYDYRGNYFYNSTTTQSKIKTLVFQMLNADPKLRKNLDEIHAELDNIATCFLSDKNSIEYAISSQRYEYIDQIEKKLGFDRLLEMGAFQFAVRHENEKFVHYLIERSLEEKSGVARQELLRMILQINSKFIQRVYSPTRCGLQRGLFRQLDQQAQLLKDDPDLDHFIRAEILASVAHPNAQALAVEHYDHITNHPHLVLAGLKKIRIQLLESNKDVLHLFIKQLMQAAVLLNHRQTAGFFGFFKKPSIQQTLSEVINAKIQESPRYVNPLFIIETCLKQEIEFLEDEMLYNRGDAYSAIQAKLISSRNSLKLLVERLPELDGSALQQALAVLVSESFKTQANTRTLEIVRFCLEQAGKCNHLTAIPASSPVKTSVR
jgi:serine/threonine protein kinase